MIRILMIVCGVSLAANAGLLYLWNNAKDAVIEERGACNVATIQASLDAERVGRVEDRKHFAALLIENERAAAQRLAALARAQDAADAARAESAAREQIIDRLMLEADFDEIPDSKECLNVFVPRRSIECMRVRASDNLAGSSDPGPGDGALCRDPCGVDSTDPACGDFSEVTFGEAIKLWGRDRDTIGVLNGRLAAIEDLSEPLRYTD